MGTKETLDKKLIIFAVAGVLVVAVIVMFVLAGINKKEDAKTDKKEDKEVVVDVSEYDDLIKEYKTAIKDFDNAFTKYAQGTDLVYLAGDVYDYGEINDACRVNLGITTKIDILSASSNDEKEEAISVLKELNPKVINAKNNVSKCKSIIDDEIQKLAEEQTNSANEKENEALQKAMEEAVIATNVLITDSDYSRKTLREKLLLTYSEPVANYATAKCEMDWTEQAKKVSAAYLEDNPNAKTEDLEKYLKDEEFEEDEIKAAINYNVDLLK